MGISRREYARRRGVVESAVRRAIATGRISVEPDGTIDPEKADRQWDDNTNPARCRGNRTTRPDAVKTERAQASGAPRPGTKPVAQTKIEAVQDILREHGGKIETGAPPGGEVSFQQARLANEIIKAQRAKVRLAKEKGELVERAKVEALFYRLAREERDAWVNWPAREAPLMAVKLGVDTAAMQKVLEAHVRAHLEERADPRIVI